MKNRYIPYGYEMVDGEYIIEEFEAEIVRYILEIYISGKSAALIAKDLTEKGIDHTEIQKAWTGGMILTIINNTAYIGTAPYPEVIDKDIWEELQSVKDSKKGMKHQTPDLKAIMPYLMCNCCGGKVRRKIQKKNFRWFCEKDIYHISVELKDNMVFEELKKFANHEIIKNQTDNIDTMTQLRKIESELEWLMTMEDIDIKTVQEKINELATLTYNSQEKVDCKVNITLKALQEIDANYNLQAILSGIESIKLSDKEIKSIELKDGTMLTKGAEKNE